MKKLFLLFAVISMIFLGCGGKALEGAFRTEGIALSYSSAVGKTFNYESKSDGISDFSISGQTSSTLYKQVIQQDIVIESASDTEIACKYIYNAIEAGTFVDGNYHAEKEEDELVGQYLTIKINKADGKMNGWEGLEDLDYSESGMDEAEGMANDMSSIVFNWFPTEKVMIDSKWEVVNDTRNTLEEGGFVEEHRVKSYHLVDFVLYKGRKCAKILIGVEITVDNETSVDDGEGNEYEVISSGMGEGDGELYFDFENGIVVYSKLAWLIEAQADITNLDTGEKDDYIQYTESHREFVLVE